MMFLIETIALILLIVIMLGLPVILVCLTVNAVIQYRNRNTRNKYYIINSTGNIFREYDEEVYRDQQLEYFNSLGYNFKAQNQIHTK